MSFWDDLDSAEEREERKTAAMRTRDEKLITDECRCASCRSAPRQEED